MNQRYLMNRMFLMNLMFQTSPMFLNFLQNHFAQMYHSTLPIQEDPSHRRGQTTHWFLNFRMSPMTPIHLVRR
jgi:hypothetical protein